MVRYLREESPRHKGFLIEAYQINAMLEDAGLPREDIAAIHAKHPAPAKPGLHIPKPSGKRMGTPSAFTGFICKSFADVVPEDFHDYFDERLQVSEPATVDKECDIFSAMCNMAIKSWRIPVAISPMSGVRRPKYFNERDRRLRGDEEQRLLEAAREEDRKTSIQNRLEELMSAERAVANAAPTVYQCKKAVKAGRERHSEEAKQSFTHIPWLETFITFQLRTGGRRSETLSLTWSNLKLEEQTAFLQETKNGRPRTLPLRQTMVELLAELPRPQKQVFPISPDRLRKAWKRICEAAGIPTDGDDMLRIHDLRHEAISRVAEAGSNTPGGFSMLDLQAFSGHRDPRMLLRYAHLCPKGLAKRLDKAFDEKDQVTTHRGRRRLTKLADVSMADVMTAPLSEHTQADGDSTGQRCAAKLSALLQEAIEPDAFHEMSRRFGNVVRVNFVRKASV